MLMPLTNDRRSNRPTVSFPRLTRRSVRFGAFVAVFAITGAAYAQHHGAPASGGTFEVRLHRPVRVGFRDRITARGESHTTTVVTPPHRPPQTRRDDESVQFRAVERVTSVDSHGKPLGIEFTVEQFQTTDPTGQHDVLAAGQVLNVVRGSRGSGEPTVTVGGSPADANVRRALGIVLTLTVDPTTDDDLFGTHTRQSVGASWPVNAALVEHELAETGAQPTVTGVVRLVRHTETRGVDALEFGMVLDATMHGMSSPPPGVTFRSGAMHSVGRTVVPVNVNAPEVESEIDMTMDMVLERPIDAQGTRGEVHVTTRRQKQVMHTPL
jgi:hypothetical protein